MEIVDVCGSDPERGPVYMAVFQPVGRTMLHQEPTFLDTPTPSPETPKKEEPSSFPQKAMDILSSYVRTIRGLLSRNRGNLSYMEDEWYINAAKVLRSKRTLARVLSFLAACLFIFFVYTIFFVNQKITDKQYVIQSHEFILSSPVTAKQTSFRYKNPARPILCRSDEPVTTVTSTEGYTMTLDVLKNHVAQYANTNPVSGAVPCACAPQFGVGVALLVSRVPRDFIGRIEQGEFQREAFLNPRIISMPLLSYSTQVQVEENSTLYPNAPPVAVARQDRCHVEYETAKCETKRYIFRGEEAFCVQMCIDLIEGKTPYDTLA